MLLICSQTLLDFSYLSLPFGLDPDPHLQKCHMDGIGQVRDTSFSCIINITSVFRVEMPQILSTYSYIPDYILSIATAYMV